MTIIAFPVRRQPPKAPEPFALAVAQMQAARASYELAMALASVDQLHGIDAAVGSPRERIDAAHCAMLLAAMRLAKTPSPRKPDILTKRRVIGRIWLGAKGEFYEQLRAGVAADETRFADLKSAKVQFG